MSFWDAHGIWTGMWLILFLAMFPRLTMLVTGICFMGFAHPILYFFGWLLTPRLTVAILATSFYWHTNPVLCVLAWMTAFIGESVEKVVIKGE